MSMDRTDNPFTPPKASVADVVQHDTQVHLPPLWSAEGRIGRLRYLCYVTVAYLLFGLFSGVLIGIGTATGASIDKSANAAQILGLIPFGIFAVLAGIKRSHDMGWSGWTILLATFVPFAAFIWLFKGGTAGPNRFGPPAPPNTTGIRIGGLVFPVLFVVGIVAAVALPAYSDYQKRARAKQEGGYSQTQDQPAPSGQAGASPQ